MSFCSAVCCQFNHEKQKRDWTGAEAGVERENQDKTLVSNNFASYK